LIFCATVINYIDRQTVSVLKTSISDDLGLSNADYAAIQNSFLVLYGISQMVSGRLYDRIGTRLGFVFSIIVWSFAAIMHATARTASTFRIWRGSSASARPATGRSAAKAVAVVPGEGARAGNGHLQRGGRARRAVSPPIVACWRPRTAGVRRSSSRGCSGSAGC
jgi:ACS family hexuronate transporter-like MFS transporter